MIDVRLSGTECVVDCAAPVIVCRRHLEGDARIRAIVVNAGNANAGTGDAGIAAAEATCVAVAAMLGCAPREVLPFSTGVIMEPLPFDKIVAALPAARAALAPDQAVIAAEAKEGIVAAEPAQRVVRGIAADDVASSNG